MTRRAGLIRVRKPLARKMPDNISCSRASWKSLLCEVSAVGTSSASELDFLHNLSERFSERRIRQVRILFERRSLAASSQA